MSKAHYYCVADHTFTIVIEASAYTIDELLPSFDVFERQASGDDMFRLTVLDRLSMDKEADLIRDFDTGNGHTSVYRVADGGYQYLIRNIRGQACCLLQTDAAFSNCRCAMKGALEMQAFGLNNALMLIYAFAGSLRQTLLIHASCVMNNGRAYPFIAKSGTGKSTHSSLWLKHIEGSIMMNDDNPVVRMIDGRAVLYGSPWSGKTPCYKDIKAPIGAIVRIERAPENSIELLPTAKAFASLLPSCSSMKWDEEIYNGICTTVTDIIASVPSYTLHCLPDYGAALLCHKTVTE